MPTKATALPEMTPYQVNVAAESYACVLMSRCGYDVAMQYGTTQPDWDLTATKAARTMHVQVKGSQDGGWGLFQGHLAGADYHRALTDWLAHQRVDIVYLFVQLNGITSLGIAPRAYVARPTEIVAHMRTVRNGHGYTALRERHKYRSGVAAGYTDIIPATWTATLARIDSV